MKTHIVKGLGAVQNGEIVSPAAIKVGASTWVQPTPERPYPRHETILSFTAWPAGEEISWAGTVPTSEITPDDLVSLVSKFLPPELRGNLTKDSWKLAAAVAAHTAGEAETHDSEYWSDKDGLSHLGKQLAGSDLKIVDSVQPEKGPEIYRVRVETADGVTFFNVESQHLRHVSRWSEQLPRNAGLVAGQEMAAVVGLMKMYERLSDSQKSDYRAEDHRVAEEQTQLRIRELAAQSGPVFTRSQAKVKADGYRQGEPLLNTQLYGKR